MKYAMNEGYCNSFSLNINTPRIIKKNITVFSIEEQLILEKHLFNNLNETTLGILISLKTGLRLGELCALRWCDIDLEEKTIKVNHNISRIKDDNGSKLVLDNPKTTSSIRVIPICSSLLKVIQTFKKEEDFFILSNSFSFLSPRTFTYRYHQILKHIGISVHNFHAIRHTFATRCIEQGVDVKTLSEILGHASVNITLNTYVHSSLELKRKQIEKISDL